MSHNYLFRKLTKIMYASLILRLFLVCSSLFDVTYALHLQYKPTFLKMSGNDSPGIEPLPLATVPPRRILLLVEPTPFNYISGYANRFQEMLKYFKKAGDIVHIITPDADPNAPREFLGYPITTLPGLSFPLYKDVLLALDMAETTKEIALEFRPDIIHVTSPGFLLMRASKVARELNIPLVISYHTNLAVYAETYFRIAGKMIPGSRSFAEFMIRRYQNQADLTLVTSTQLGADLRDIGVRRVDVWQKGINVDLFSPTFKSRSMRSLLTSGHPESPLLIYIGRLGKEKRLQGLKRVLEENPTARLAFVGKGPYEEELKVIFKGMNVVFAGNKLSEAYASADLFLMPSDSETLGFVVLEAMASGVPVVGVAAGGLTELIQNDKTGYLVSNSDGYYEFSQRVQALLSNVELRTEMGRQARIWAELLGWEAATSKLRNTQYQLAIDLCNLAKNSEAVGRDTHLSDVESFLMNRAGLP